MNPFNNDCFRKYDYFNTHLDFSRKVKVFRDLCQNNSKYLMQQGVWLLNKEGEV
ncbi:hypothetical protein CNT_KDOLBLKC_02688 [Bacillus subtilis]